MKYEMKHLKILALGLCAAAVLAGCGTGEAARSVEETAAAPVSAAEETFGASEEEMTLSVSDVIEETETAEAPETIDAPETSELEAEAETEEPVPAETLEAPEEIPQVVTVANVTSGGIMDAAEFFTERDLIQTPDLGDAQTCNVVSGEDVHITTEGVYVLTGSAENVTVWVEAADTDKVELVLDNLTITNGDFPCVYVTEADKVFVTLTGDSSLSVTGAFQPDGETNTDGVIFSKKDLTLKGTGSLSVDSTDNGIVCKDDLKVTGGTYTVTAAAKAFEAGDSIRICDGVFYLYAGSDGLHAADDDDDTTGSLYICGGSFTIEAGDDGIHAVTQLQIDGGAFDITCAEGIEATVVQINDGVISISASDDGINGAWKSSDFSPLVEFNGGEITVVMGAGDTDGIDCNGDLTINGGYIDVTGGSCFDYDGTGSFTGGTLVCNGQTMDTLPNQMMGGRGGRGGFGGW